MKNLLCLATFHNFPYKKEEYKTNEIRTCKWCGLQEVFEEYEQFGWGQIPLFKKIEK